MPPPLPVSPNPAASPHAPRSTPPRRSDSTAQPRFLNAVVALETSLSPRDLLDALLAIERDFGRDRSASIPNGPRTLDLDILLYGDLIVSVPGLEIPHPRLAQRAFVLVPLAEIAPNLRDPRYGSTIAQLLAGLRPQADPGAAVPIQSPFWPAEQGQSPKPTGLVSGH